eukprot:Gb_15108 [translate_table: standard]
MNLYQQFIMIMNMLLTDQFFWWRVNNKQLNYVPECV